ncbi:hypothetical protein, partial [Pseudoxanthomonas suwonensis]|uniref:hypothetical protein n=1 Tax=Pseudoxanthomonas suwonensis TaxID=314722 RepID=UPI001B885652
CRCAWQPNEAQRASWLMEKMTRRKELATSMYGVTGAPRQIQANIAPTRRPRHVTVAVREALRMGRRAERKR